MWVYIIGTERSYGGIRWEVYADPAFDVDQFGLDLFINGDEYCNSSPIFGELGEVEMGCESYEPRGSGDPRMHAAVGRSGMECALNQNHTERPYNLVYACRWL